MSNIEKAITSLSETDQLQTDAIKALLEVVKDLKQRVALLEDNVVKLKTK